MTKIRAVFKRRWLLLVAGLVLGVAAGAGSSMMAPERDDTVDYRVSQLIVANRAATQQGNVEQDVLRVSRGAVAAKAAEKLGESDPDDLSSSVSATPHTESASIEVSASDPDPEVATATVEAYVGAFLEVVNSDMVADQERRLADLQAQLDQAEAELEAFNKANPTLGSVPSLDPMIDQALTQQRADLRQRVDEAKSQLQTEQLNAKSTLPYSTLGADAPKAVDSDLLPVPTAMPFRMALLGVFGLVLSVGLVMILERLMPRIDTRDELVDAVDLPVLAEIGLFAHHKLPTADDGTLSIEGAWAEPYRRIRSAIQFVQAGRDNPQASTETAPRVFMVASPSPSEGKSTTTAVTALAMAEAGMRTLVIGGDYRRPAIHKLLGVASAPGIREHARMDVDRPTLDQIVHRTTHANLFVAPSGMPGKEIVGLADAAKELVAEAVTQGATVIMDTSPVEVANDTIDLLPVVDRVILVVRSGRTTVKSLTKAIDQLRQHGGEIMGTVLIGTPGLARRQYYYEGYYASSTPGGGGGAWPPGDDDPNVSQPVVNGTPGEHRETGPAEERVFSEGGGSRAGAAEPVTSRRVSRPLPPPFTGHPHQPPRR